MFKAYAAELQAALVLPYWMLGSQDLHRAHQGSSHTAQAAPQVMAGASAMSSPTLLQGAGHPW